MSVSGYALKHSTGRKFFLESCLFLSPIWRLRSRRCSRLLIGVEQPAPTKASRSRPPLPNWGKVWYFFMARLLRTKTHEMHREVNASYRRREECSRRSQQTCQRIEAVNSR